MRLKTLVKWAIWWKRCYGKVKLADMTSCLAGPIEIALRSSSLASWSSITRMHRLSSKRCNYITPDVLCVVMLKKGLGESMGSPINSYPKTPI